MLARIIAASLAALSTLAPLADASRSNPEATLIDESDPGVRIGSPSPFAAICTLGPPGQSQYRVDWLMPPQDRYFTLLTPGDCPACGPGTGVALGAAHLVLHFPVTPCSIRVEVSVVRAAGPPECPVPLDAAICPVRSVTLVAPSNGGTFDFSVPLEGCLLTGRAFLKVAFHGLGGDCATKGVYPQLVTSSSCLPCFSYNAHGTSLGDLCKTTSAFPGNPRMYAEVAYCGVLDVTDPRVGTGLQLEPAFPNPARGEVTIGFALPRAGTATLRVFDLAGAVVRTLVEGDLAAGRHVAVWDRTRDHGGRAQPGLYFYALESGGVRRLQRVVVIE